MRVNLLATAETNAMLANNHFVRKPRRLKTPTPTEFRARVCEGMPKKAEEMSREDGGQGTLQRKRPCVDDHKVVTATTSPTPTCPLLIWTAHRRCR